MKGKYVIRPNFSYALWEKDGNQFDIPEIFGHSAYTIPTE
jgi:hypothetical protein